MNYSVGQVLYVVFKKDSKVIPMQVTEEITRKSLSGLHIDYVVRAGTSADSTISLESILKEGEVFDTPEQAIDVLSSRAKASITKLVTLATQKAHQWYGPTRQPETKRLEAVILDENETVHEVNKGHEKIRVVLPDGTVANASLPANLPSTPHAG